MSQRSSASAMDLYLTGIKTGIGAIGPADKMVACSAEPTTFTEANSTFALADVAMTSGDFTIAAGDGGGNVARKITVAAKSAVLIDANGTATHISLVDTVNSLLLYATTCTPQALTSGLAVNFTSWKIEVGAPPATSLLPESGLAVPTFNCMSLYYNAAEAPTSSTLPFDGPKVWVRFRPESSDTWSEGYPLWYDSRTTGTGLPYAYNCRGSVVNLTPGTAYVFEFGFGISYAAATWAFHVTGTTWSETFIEDSDPTIVPTGGAYIIEPGMGGSAATGYKVFDGTASMNTRTGGETGGPSGGDRAAGGTTNSGVVWVRDSYVIVRRLTLRKGAQNSIYIADGITNVVIEDCDMADMSWHPRLINGGTWAMNETAGVKLAGNNSRIVIQRNKIHHPHRGSWTWDLMHPEGCFPIFIQDGGQQNVIRHNEWYADIAGTGIPSESNPWWYDGIGGDPNFSVHGSPGADSDVYGNIGKNCLDDGIELEGGGRNVRVWGNYLDHNAINIANTTVHFGPMYVWRNITNRQRFKFVPQPDSDVADSSIFKNYGTVGGFGGGKKFFFHNTALQTPGSEHSPTQTNTLGAGQGNVGPMNNTVSRNNILHIKKVTNDSVRVSSSGGTSIGVPANSFANDLYNGGLTNVSITNGIPGTPTYQASHGWSSIPALGGSGTGNYQLGSGSLGLNAGVVIPNFNDSSSSMPFSGAGPDVGAHESGAAPMKFGITP